MTSARTGILLLLLLLAPQDATAQRSEANFNHPKHQKLFPTCSTCHAGAASAGAPMWPEAASCRSCHDGTIQKPVAWRPPTEPIRSNVRFEHQRHALAIAAAPTAARGLDPTSCVSCHSAANAPWMSVRWAIAERCLDCHRVRGPHLAAPDTACATCHVTLAQASRLTIREIASFDAPPSHDLPGFEGRLHGVQAAAQAPVSPSCATCHARDFCVQCHVDAPEQRVIQALAPDPRSLGITARLEAPPSHASPNFVVTHGAMARRAPRDCSTCHTRESCLTCHATLPRAVAAQPAAAPGRAAGAAIVRRPPATHGQSFVREHRNVASSVPRTCAGCHVRSDCLECHRPDAAAAPSYHPKDFLTRHPAAAYTRESSCATCHNVGGFCSSCHVNSGLIAQRTLRSGYHDARTFFIAGHGGAARQSLESCVSCHVERDCLTCHSVLRGRRFNPHGPGFDPQRLAKKNPQMCTVCHGAQIPTR